MDVMDETMTDLDRHDLAVELYQAGRKTAEITARTGVERPHLYYLLEKRGLQPNRQKRENVQVTVGHVLELWRAANREIGRLEEALRHERALRADLEARLTPAS